MVPAIQDRVHEEMDLRRRVGQQPDDGEGHRLLARLLIRQGALRKARSHLEWALHLRPHGARLREQVATVDRILDVLEG